MTRDEVQEFIDHLKRTADNYQKQSKNQRLPVLMRIRDQASESAYLTIAHTLTEALEKSEARPAIVPTRREVRLPHAEAIARGIDYGSAWASTPRELPEAGPGLWRGVGLWSDGGAMVLTVEQVTP